MENIAKHYQKLLNLEHINNKSTILDIGANIGTTVLSLSKLVGSKGKVLAFEPQTQISQCLTP